MEKELISLFKNITSNTILFSNLEQQWTDFGEGITIVSDKKIIVFSDIILGVPETCIITDKSTNSTTTIRLSIYDTNL